MSPTIPNTDFLPTPDADRLEILADQLHKRLVGGDPSADSSYSRREIMLALEEVRAARQGEVNRLNKDTLVKWTEANLALNKAQYYEDYDAIYKLGGSADAWIKSYKLEVFDDEERGLRYCLLPAQFLALRRYQNLPSEEGIQAVEFVKWSANGNFNPDFIPFANGAHRIMQGLFAGGIQGNIGYWRDDDRMYFFRENGQTFTEKQIRASFVLRPARDTLPEPGLLQDATDMDMVMGAEQMLRRRGPEDRVSDNVPALAS